MFSVENFMPRLLHSKINRNGRHDIIVYGQQFKFSKWRFVRL